MALGTYGLTSLLRRLEEGRLDDAALALHGHLSQIPRMRRSAELHGHAGCVNRLALSEDASTLLSASDDCSLRLWDVPTLRPRAVLVPGHVSNVFGVAFMPHTNDSYVCSAGLDTQVRHTNVHTGASTLWTCHQKMVKTVVAQSSNVFISAAKDGTARRFDARVPPFHSNYAPSNILVRIASPGKRLRGLNSAVLSPISDNHLLVAAQEPCLRIYDLRKCGSFVTRAAQRDQELHHSSIGDCIQRISPPHMHDSAPETGSLAGIRKKTYATFATYSPDAKQVVASFYDDMVHVFDLPNHDHPVTCRSPFTSRAHKRLVVFRLLQDCVCDFASHRPSRALGRANRILDFDPDNVLALVFRAEALIRRNSYGDLRSSFATLSRIINIVQEDHTRIAQLWGTHTADGPLCMSPDSPKCAQRAEIWLKVFQYKQAHTLYRMTPNRRDIHQPPSAKLFLKKRLEHLDILLTELEKFRDANLCPKVKHFAQEKALGDSFEQKELYCSYVSKARGETLERFFGSFFEGVPALRKAIDNSINILLRDPEVNHEYRCPSESIDSCSTDSDDDIGDNKHQAVEIFEQLQQQVGNSEEEAANIWGPPPSAQQGWRSFYGHTSKQTDIKEARFYGAQNQVVLSGSDDGKVYMWSAKTGELLVKVPGDEQIVNCVLPHPTRAMIINSGIDNTIKVITPQGRDPLSSEGQHRSLITAEGRRR